MKFRSIVFIPVLLSLLITSCDDASKDIGKEIQPDEDGIVVKQDTFHLSTETVPVENIISRPDSFLLGEYDDKNLGLTKADILAEFKLFQEGFQFIDSSKGVVEVDSVVMTLGFNSSFGKVNSPLHISVYELKQPLTDDEYYLSDMDPEPYIDRSKLIGDSKFTVQDGITETTTTQVRFHLSEAFKERFFTTNPLHYRNQAEFKKFFPGVYITTDFGGITMLNLQDINITLYYNYAYNEDLSQKLYGFHEFFVNSEVPKVNRIIHPYRPLTFSPNDEFNYITSPANYYTRIRIPLEKIRQQVNVGEKVLAVNSASIKVNVKKQLVEDESLIPYVSNLLLIKEDSLTNFFSKMQSLSSTTSFLATRDSVYQSQNNYDYQYNFSGLAALIEKEVKDKNNTAPYLNMVLVPVTPLYTYSTSTSAQLSEIIQSNLMQSVTIYSGKNKTIPMKLEVVYSGF
ncbi:MAG: DUF4270 domain-containing protein [Paludibacteraceae bacterium]